ncbi:MAG: phytoene/squalene synthase family protein [Bacteroidia bacterium]|nr:phytoene/squalene synthase family protein [Bacteroidia bacterium]MCF8426591.1 phytoene/squalene synthase family protein [Bacteroidia bacterium]MCF8448034.1 phytoene/squalene synthase family protein [Bacteroidia bacterium]
MKELFDKIAIKNSRSVTQTYSTSFSMGIRFLAKRFQDPIYAVYGFVRLADEIVDSFHGYPKKQMLDELKEETYRAIDRGISTNPLLHSFQDVVNTYTIDRYCIDTFLKSMEMDLFKQEYNQKGYEEYILGSAEVVGLMCLRVFTENNNSLFEELKPYAMKLGSAFQKINFLRDFKADKDGLGRMYFPQMQENSFNEETKREIELDILADFEMGFEGIKKLPKDARFGVYVAYIYYSRLLHKIMQIPASEILESRIRISDKQKFALFFGSYLRHSFNLL